MDEGIGAIFKTRRQKQCELDRKKFKEEGESGCREEKGIKGIRIEYARWTNRTSKLTSTTKADALRHQRKLRFSSGATRENRRDPPHPINPVRLRVHVVSAEYALRSR
jgi:hypothetical protein